MQSQQSPPAPSVVERRDQPEQPPWGLQPPWLQVAVQLTEGGVLLSEVERQRVEQAKTKFWDVDEAVENVDHEEVGPQAEEVCREDEERGVGVERR